MILKTSNLLYLFDFDGTLAGSDDWVGFIHNCKLSFKNLHFNPHKFDIRWSILTSRPKIDKFLVRAVCIYHRLYPELIITAPTWTWKFENSEQEFKYKDQTIKSILSGDYSKKFERPITKVCYIDNNVEMIRYLNEHRESYRYIALTISDFVHKDYVQLLSGDD